MRFLMLRVARLAGVLLAVSLIAFALVSLSGDPAVAMAGEGASPEDLQAIRQQFGYDQPVAVQYGHWLAKLLGGNLGYSYYLKRDVVDVLLERLPVTAILAVGATLFALALALPLGIAAAVFQGGALDRLAQAMSMLGQSLPSFMVAFVLMYVFGVQLRWLPISGTASALSYVLPIVALGIYSMPPLIALMRSEMLAVLRADYIRMAQAKGLPAHRVVLKHALRNALAPVVALTTVQLGHMLGGTIVVETIFSVQGLGNLAWQCIQRADFETLQALMLLTTLSYTLLTLFNDLVNALLNPRLRSL